VKLPLHLCSLINPIDDISTGFIEPQMITAKEETFTGVLVSKPIDSETSYEEISLAPVLDSKGEQPIVSTNEPLNDTAHNNLRRSSHRPKPSKLAREEIWVMMQGELEKHLESFVAYEAERIHWMLEYQKLKTSLRVGHPQIQKLCTIMRPCRSQTESDFSKQWSRK
jgi:hypothetical protein